jgi:hypothetical protein
VHLGERGLDPGIEQHKQLEKMSRQAKGAGVVFNLLAGVKSLRDGNYRDAALQFASSGVDAATLVVESAGESKLGKVLGTTGNVLGGVGVAVNAYDTYQAYRHGNEVAMVEKGLDTAAGTAALSGALPSTVAALETAPAGALGVEALATGMLEAPLAGAVVAFGTGYVAGRGLSSVTGLDGVVTNGFEGAVFNDGRKQLDHIELRSKASSANSRLMSNRELLWQAQHDSAFVGRAITGALTEIEQANAAGDASAKQLAENTLRRLRAVQARAHEAC